MPIENAKRDENYVTTLQGVDMTTGTLPTRVYVDETTHRLLVSAVITSGSIATTSPTYLTEVDKSVTDIIYIGKATPGTATSAASWQIKKIDKTVTNAVTISYANAGAFTATWNNRGSETYS